MKNAPFTALLLAGGASTRMGRPKALVDLKGKPLWQVQLEKLSALAPAELFISLPAGLEIQPGTGKIVRDEKPDLGPLSGLVAARRLMTGEWLLVLAIDLPQMTAAYLRRLLQAAFASGLGQVPEMDGRHLGLAAVYPRAFLDRQLEAHLRGADRSFQRLVRAGLKEGTLASRAVSEPERALFKNMNRPEDLIA